MTKYFNIYKNNEAFQARFAEYNEWLEKNTHVCRYVKIKS